MLNHYFKIILRTAFNNKVYTFINLTGLTTGMVVFLLIMLYVNYEFSVDQYHENKDYIYRVAQHQEGNMYMGNDRFAVTMAPLGPALKDEFPYVESATRIVCDRNSLVKVGEETFLEPIIHGIDADAFQMFTFEYLYGNPDTYLIDKYSAVISESIAEKYFDKENPIGKTFLYTNQEFVVAGVIKDMPPYSHFTMDLMLPFKTMVDKDNITHWNNSNYYTYVLLNKESSPGEVESKFPLLLEKYGADQQHMNSNKRRLFLQKFSKIHLYSKTNFDLGQTTNVNSLYIYSTIAILILLIASINYMNLATARATTRAKEIGVRKVVGAYRFDLITQFLGESLLLTFFSLLFSLLIIALVLPFFEQFIELDLSINMTENPESIILILLVCGFVGIISGSYPALALSAIKPISVLKGSFVKSANKSFMRNILVVTQFVISGCLITSALIIIQQLNYIQHKDMGYRRDHIITLHINDWDFVNKVNVFNKELMKVPGVMQVTSSSNLPNNITNLNLIAWPGKPDDISWDIYGGRAGFNFTELYNIEIVKGRTFSRMEGDENGAVLINESAARLLPWDDPIGRELIRWRDTCRIVGVMKDFHQHSLHQEIMPLQLFFNENERKISIKISGDNIEQTLAGIKKTKEVFSKKYPFEYTFFDDEFDKAYKSELKTAKLANWSTLITIIIACMGLYGLATFIAEQRIKEVGIRKVLGAKVFHLVFLLSRDFTLLVIISFVISAPIAYYLMRQWLSDFAYHISIGLQTFIGTLFIMILISWITVGYQTFRVAISNPIKALKDE